MSLGQQFAQRFPRHPQGEQEHPQRHQANGAILNREIRLSQHAQRERCNQVIQGIIRRLRGNANVNWSKAGKVGLIIDHIIIPGTKHGGRHFSPHGLIELLELRPVVKVNDLPGKFEMSRLVIVPPGGNQKDVKQALNQSHQQDDEQCSLFQSGCFSLERIKKALEQLHSFTPDKAPFKGRFLV